MFWVPPQERVKLRTSNFVETFIGSIRTKAQENVGNSSRGCSQGVPKMFNCLGHPCIGALRGHLCDGTAFLFQKVFAIFKLSQYGIRNVL